MDFDTVDHALAQIWEAVDPTTREWPISPATPATTLASIDTFESMAESSLPIDRRTVLPRPFRVPFLMVLVLL
jgi:hypothetical protein